MAVTFRAATAAHISSGNLSINIPASAQANDVAVLFVDAQLNTVNFTTPSGWTLIDDAVGAANIKSTAWYKVLSAGEGGTSVSVVNDNGTIRIVGEIVAYRGVDTTTPIQVYDKLTANVSGTVRATPTVSATGAGMLVEHVADRGNPVGTDWTAPGGQTERVDDRSIAAGVNVSAASGDASVSGAGSVGGDSWTTTQTTSHYAVWSIVLNEGIATSGFTVEEDFEGGSVGSDVTSSNSNFTSTDYSSASAKFSTTQFIKTAQSAVITLGGTSARAGLRYAIPDNQPVAFMRWYQYVDTVSANTLIGFMRHDSTMIAQLRINSDKTLRIYDNSTATATSTDLVPLQQWLRFEWMVNTNTGLQELRMFAGNHVNDENPENALIILSGTVATANQINELSIGVTAASTNYTAYYDAFKATDADWIGPDPDANTPHFLVISSAVGVSGVWRPVVNAAVGVSGVWRPLTKIGFGQGGQWRPAVEDPTIPPGDNPLPIIVSPDAGGSSLSVELDETISEGWGGGWFSYFPNNPSFNADWTAITGNHPEGLPSVVSPKGTDSTALNNFFSTVPSAWAEKMIACYWQEPEDDFIGDSQIANYRAAVHQYAGIVRPFGVRNGVHLQEWTLNPINGQPWAGEANLAKFVQDVEDIDYVSWSLYVGRGASGTPNIDRIVNFMNTYCAGISWGATASGSPVRLSDPIGGSVRLLRAQIVRDMGDYLVAQGGEAFGWFNFEDYQGDGQHDNLVSKDPDLLAAMQYVASLLY